MRASWLDALGAAALLAISAQPASARQAEQAAPPAAIGMIDAACPGSAATVYDPQADWAWLCRYHAANAALAGKAVDAVFIGDSITEFWAHFQPELFALPRVNRGISGQTSPQVLLRFMADVVALKPGVVHLMIGTNDIAGNTGPTTPEAYKNNLRAMVDLAQAHGIRVVLGSIPPADRMSWRPGLQPALRIAELNLWLKAFAAERGLIYADYFAVLSGPNGEMRAEFTQDGVHPGAAGYAAMEPVARAALAQALQP